MGMCHHRLSDEQWERIKDLWPGRVSDVGGTTKDNRLFVEAVLYKYRTGIPRRDMPEGFGDFQVIHTRMSRWAKSGVWQRVFAVLSADADSEVGDTGYYDWARPPAQCGGKRGDSEAIGRSKGGLSTKIHAVVDALGNTIGLHLSEGQASDARGCGCALSGCCDRGGDCG